MAKGHGGSRKGAGRKISNHTIETQELKKQLIKLFAKDAKKIYAALMKRAESGDVMAIRELLDRVFGKSSQGIDLTSKGEAFTVIFGNADDKLDKDKKAS